MGSSSKDVKAVYESQLRALQIELVKLQRYLILEGARVLVIFEGRDGAGKDGSIMRLIEHMSPRETRIHAPGKPSGREETEWYYQRFVPHLPAAREFVVFNRSWYNRAGVERVMGFCRADQVKDFFETVVPFEQLLVHDGIFVRKYYLDIDHDEQQKRLRARSEDPLKQWKISPVDEAAGKNWKAYSLARDEMLERTSHDAAPWHIVLANDKKSARLEIIRDLLCGFEYPDKDKDLVEANSEIIFRWTKKSHQKLAP